MREALCIHRHESVGWHRDHVDWRGSPSLYSGGLQFMVRTWRSAGGAGDAWQWSPREQLWRAYLVWDRDAGKPHDGIGSWREWGSRRACGLR
jgi:hypothetical protein